MIPGVGLALVALLATPSPTPCFHSLKFGGAIYLDSGQALASGQVGDEAGETDPNPAPCGIPDRVAVYHVSGRPATEALAYRAAGGEYELYTSAGPTGFPLGGLLRWGVVLLAIVIVVFAALPALTAHLRQPRDDVSADEDSPDGDH